MSLGGMAKKSQDIDDGLAPAPICAFCKKPECYEVILTKEGFLIKRYYYHKESHICKECSKWMENAGGWVTVIIEFLLRIKIKIRTMCG